MSTKTNIETYLLPSSFSQQRIWFFEKLFPNSPTYNIPFILKFHGKLNPQIIEKALNEMISRHEVFRTTFLEIDGKPKQKVVSKATPFKLSIQTKGEIEKTIDFQEYMQSYAQQTFDLFAGPLFKFELIKLEEERYYLLVNIHHIIFDAWSMDIFKNELLTFYSDIENEQPYSLKNIEFHYADYAQWEIDLIEGETGKKHAEFWKKYFQDVPNTLGLPTDFPRGKNPKYEGKTFSFSFPSSLVKKVRTYVQTKGITLNTYFMAIFNLMLYRFTQDPKIVIGTPISNRKSVYTQNLIGFFVNTIPIKTEISPQKSFEYLLEATVKSFLRSYEHGNLPFEKIVQAINPERENTYHPIFQTLFTYHEQSTFQNRTDLFIEQEKIFTNTSKFDFVFYITTSADHGRIEIEYNANLFHENRINELIQYYCYLIEETLVNPQMAIAKISVLAEEYLGNLDHDLVTSEYVHQRFIKQALLYSEKIAIRFENKSYTFKQLNEMANQIANEILKRKIPIESPIGILMQRCPEQIAAILGVLKVGCHYLPIDPNLPTNRLNYILEDSGTKYLITDKKTKQENIISIVIQTSDVFKSSNCIEPVLNIKTPPEELLAYMIYTSGSSGKPKGVKLSHLSLINHIDSFLNVFPIAEDEKILQNITFSFDASITEIFSSVLTGSTLVLSRSDKQFDISYLSNLIFSESVTRAQLFHSLIENLLENPDFLCSKDLRLVITGGESLSQSLVNKFYNKCNYTTKLINVYGPTEGTVATSYYQCKKNDTFPNVPIGKPFNNYLLKILDSHLNPVPNGAIGELFIGGPGVAKGYVHNSHLTNEKFFTFNIKGKEIRFYRTGDLVKKDIFGNIHFISRKDSQVKIRGFRIELNEIKNVLLNIPGIEQAIVRVKESLQDKKLYCFLVKKNNNDFLNAKQVKIRLIEELPYYMIPSSITFIDQIPISLNGKLLDEKLPYHKNDLMSDTIETFQGSTEILLSAIWKEILDLQHLNRNDDFFDIGGHSIKAIELISAIRKKMNIELPIAALFEYRTIAMLSNWIDRQDSKQKNNIVIPLKKKINNTSPLFLIHPGGGGILCYVPLIKALNIHGAIYGIQSIGYDDSEAPLTSIYEMATKYVMEIKKIQKEGPYRLAGWSMGGTIAFEMAGILENEGNNIDFIGLLDAHPFTTDHTIDHYRDPLQVWAHSLCLDLNLFDNLSKAQKLHVILEAAKKKKLLPDTTELKDVERIISVMGANNHACSRYTFKSLIKSDLFLFKCFNQDALQPHPLINVEEWGIRTTGNVTLIKLAGNHNNIMTSPQVEILANEMNKILNQKEVFSFESNRTHQSNAARNS